jgi:hypothetical protein
MTATHRSVTPNRAKQPRAAVNKTRHAGHPTPQGPATTTGHDPEDHPHIQHERAFLRVVLPRWS